MGRIFLRGFFFAVFSLVSFTTAAQNIQPHSIQLGNINGVSQTLIIQYTDQRSGFAVETYRSGIEALQNPRLNKESRQFLQKHLESLQGAFTDIRVKLENGKRFQKSGIL